jgi:hypothetical protein
MDNTLKTLINIYNMNDIDWMGYKLQERYSYHHIVKRCHGGERTFNNGAVLYLSSHSYLHTIEYYDLQKYIFINNILKDINTQRYMPTIEQLKQIDYILREFEKEHEGEVSTRGKVLIKDEYRKRILWKKKV